MQKKKGLLTRLFARKQGDEVEVEPEIDEASAPTVADTLPHTVLVFTPEQEEQFAAEFKEELYKKLNSMPPVQIGEINIAPFEAGSLYGGYYVKVFVRHASDLEDEFELEELPLYLIDASGDVVAADIFRPQNFGTLRFGEARYWGFVWGPGNVVKKDADFSSFTIAFSS